jgi:hypothetical protein
MNINTVKNKINKYTYKISHAKNISKRQEYLGRLNYWNTKMIQLGGYIKKK